MSKKSPNLITRLRWTAYQALKMRGQARFPFRPLDQIHKEQARRVRAMVAYAYRHVPYYQETMSRMGLRSSDFETAADLAQLPIIERDQVQRDPTYFVSTAQPLEEYLELRSGGSTGAPRAIYHNAAALFESRAHGQRERSILKASVGASAGHRETIFVPPITSGMKVGAFCQQHSITPTNLAIERQYLSLLDPPEENLPRVNAFKPDLWRGYGSYMETLFAYLDATGAPFHRPKAVAYTSDALSAPARRLIEEKYGIPVFGAYRAIETFKLGFECQEHNGYHLNIDLYPLRIVGPDGEPLPPGESGDVIVSNLVNRATVLLNYRLGDLAATLPGPCACGRTLPRLSVLHGRNDDWIQLASGKIVHPQAIRVLFTNESSIWQYRVVQQAPDHFQVAIVSAEQANPEEMARRITARFIRQLGSDITVDVAFVESIERTPGGKLRPILSMAGARPLDAGEPTQ